MTLIDRFKPRTPDVIHEIIDGEAVIVNLANGKYYSTDKSGAFIWSLIDQGLPVQQVILTVADHYTGDMERIEKGVHQIIEQLQQEQLITTDFWEDENPAGHFDIKFQLQGKPPFEDPILHLYTDMEDLLLLDPVHEVDDSGWPNQPPKTDE